MEENVHVLAIAVKNRQKNAPRVNSILTDCGDMILARMGIHYEKCDINVITVIVAGAEKNTRALLKKLNSLKGVSANTISLEV
jgi:putative iron-only hydrogenase system regulator